MFRLSMMVLITGMLASGPSLVAQERERLLIPLFLDVPVNGAFATRWRTDLTIWNPTADPIVAFQSLCSHTCKCVAPSSGCRAHRPIGPGEEYSGILERNDDRFTIPAILFNVLGAADRLAMNLRLIDEQAGVGVAGTEVPIVHERDFKTATTWLVGIPTLPNSRRHLRVYFVSSPSGFGAARVRVYSDDGGLLSDQVLNAVLPLTHDVPNRDDEDAAAPGFAIMLIDTEWQGGDLKVRIDPVTPDLEFWAMASVTSNLSQTVTLFTPQP